jgi:hypothetical protein
MHHKFVVLYRGPRRDAGPLLTEDAPGAGAG